MGAASQAWCHLHVCHLYGGPGFLGEDAGSRWLSHGAAAQGREARSPNSTRAPSAVCTSLGKYEMHSYRGEKREDISGWESSRRGGIQGRGSGLGCEGPAGGRVLLEKRVGDGKVRHQWTLSSWSWLAHPCDSVVNPDWSKTIPYGSGHVIPIRERWLLGKVSLP